MGSNEQLEFETSRSPNMSIEEFCEACRSNNHSEVERMIEMDQTIVNQKGSIGCTGLMWAISLNHLNVFNKIISTPILDLELKTSYDWTVLHICCNYNRVECLKELLQHPQCSKELVEIKDRWGRTAAIRAQRYDNLECVQFIEEFIGSQKTAFNETRAVLEAADLSDSSSSALSSIDNHSHLHEDLKSLSLAELRNAINVVDMILESKNDQLKAIHEKHLKAVSQHEKKLEEVLSNHDLKGEELERKHKEEVENMEQQIAEAVLKKKNLWDEVNTLQARMGSSSTVSITECYVCFEPMKPPIHIFTCGIGGHAVCELCLNQMNPKRCGQCQSTSFVRATALEQIISNILNSS